jgi:hypothetical protein
MYLSVLLKKITELRVFIPFSIVFFILLPQQLLGYISAFKLSKKIRYPGFEISITAICLHLLRTSISDGTKASIVHLLQCFKTKSSRRKTIRILLNCVA